MATPISPVIPNLQLPEVIYAKDQPEYQPLPCYKNPDGTIVTRWKLTWKERFLTFWRGDIYLFVSTFNQPLQPLMIQVERPTLSEE